jgi:hypothetical protein
MTERIVGVTQDRGQAVVDNRTIVRGQTIKLKKLGYTTLLEFDGQI